MKKWTTKFPTPNKKDKKWWWFYGWPFGKLDPTYLDREPPVLILVECTKVSNGYLYVGNGHFIYKSEATGVFKEFEGIDTPNTDELKDMISSRG